MREFFRGWKRKIGVLTLVLACVFTWFWIRSTSSGDRIFPSQDGTILESTIRGIETGYVAWEATPIDPTSESDSNFEYEGHQVRAWLGFLVEKKAWIRVMTREQLGQVTVYVIPYWSIIIPLTALSTYLLVSKQRLPKKPVPHA